jgi:hypothetical protein
MPGGRGSAWPTSSADGGRIRRTTAPPTSELPLAVRASSGGKIRRTGLPPELQAGVEALSGLSLDGVRVHYDSPRPARLGALAYAHGSEIHVAPGQERHLPHEAWHVVQQARADIGSKVQRRDRVAVNDEERLEREADVMGARALAIAARFDRSPAPHAATGDVAPAPPAAPLGNVAQLRKFSTRAGPLDTDIGIEALHQEVLPTLMTPSIDGDGLAGLYTAVMTDIADRLDGSAMLLLDQIEAVARAAIEVLRRDPDVARLHQLGLLDQQQILFWLSSDYDDRPPPENLARGTIAEALSSEAQRRKHGDGAEVVSGLKVRSVKTDNDIAEIDNLTVTRTRGGKLRPVEVVEAKAGSVKKGKMITQLSGKVKGLRAVAEGSARLMHDDVDVTATYDLMALDVAMTTAMSDPAADTELNPDEITRLYQAMYPLRVAGFTSLRALAI